MVNEKSIKYYGDQLAVVISNAKTGMIIIESTLDCPSSKGNHAPHPIFERPNGKNKKSKKF